jgi:plastocyanin
MARRPFIGRSWSWTVVSTVLLAALAGCGGGGGKTSTPANQQPTTPTAAGGRVVSKIAGSEFKFAPSSVTVKRGSSITFDNAGTIGHDLKVRRDSKILGGTSVIQPGKTATLKVSFPAGTYTMFCSVPGHEQSGMKGTFTVR